MKTKKIGFIFSFLVYLFYVTDASAGTLNVPSQFSTISSAISASHSGDLILVSAGTYNERLNIRKNIEIRSVSGVQSTIIDGQQGGSVILIANTKYDGSVPKISGFTIRNGKSPEGQGGGITLINSDAIVENNIITNNSGDVDSGGILAYQNSDATIRNNTISFNTAKRFGGGIYVVTDSDPLIYNNTISNNSATGTNFTNGGSGGGGIYIDDNSSPQIVKNTVSSNHADHAGGGIGLRVGCDSIIEENIIDGNDSSYGGGIHVETEGGSPQIINNTITNNRAPYSYSYTGSGWGGGISIYNQSNPLIKGNSISENSASQGGNGIVVAENANASIFSNFIFQNINSTIVVLDNEGGGIYIANASATIKNNVIYLNESSNGGGLSFETGSTSTIENNTIVKNISSAASARGGGIYVRNNATSVSVNNNIITQNNDYQIFEDNKKATFTNNLINNDGSGIYYGNDGVVNNINDMDSFNSNSLIDASGNISGDESFVDSNNNNYAIQSSSTAKDSGSGSSLIYDIEYNLKSQTLPNDIGAYEYTTILKNTNPVYRFWSDSKQHHFYTINTDERNVVMNTYKLAEWKYEGQAFRAIDLAYCNNASQVFRFWSDTKQGHFYTISEDEKNFVVANYLDDVWRYESPAYCAETSSSGTNTALYRFWSDSKQGHFYTADSGEKTYIENTYPSNVWRYESVGYYVYPNL